jgi:hypothetical protein
MPYTLSFIERTASSNTGRNMPPPRELVKTLAMVTGLKTAMGARAAATPGDGINGDDGLPAKPFIGTLQGTAFICGRGGKELLQVTPTRCASLRAKGPWAKGTRSAKVTALTDRFGVLDHSYGPETKNTSQAQRPPACAVVSTFAR